MMKKIINFIASPYLLLFLVLIFSFVIRGFNLYFNSPFVDEATYVLVGGKILAGAHEGLPINWVGGMPLFYPILSFIFYKIGGITMIRLINVLLGTISLAVMYYLIKDLNLFENKKLDSLNGLLGTLFFSIAPIHFTLSRLAIYDMLAFTLLVGGLLYLQKAINENDNNKYYQAGSLLILSFLAKYSVLIILPAIFIVSVLAARKIRHSILGIRRFITVIIAGIGIYFLFFFKDLFNFFTKIAYGAGKPLLSDILGQFWELTSIWYIFSALAVIIFFKEKKYKPLVFFLLSFSPLIIHLVFNNITSIKQDTIFTLIFLLPISASFFTNIYKNNSFSGILLTLITILIILFTHTFPKVWALEHFWPDTTEAMNILKKEVKGDDTILAESGDIVSLTLEGMIPQENIVTSSEFSYEEFVEKPAIEKALKEGVFKFIELDKTTEGLFDHVILEQINQQYILIYNSPPLAIYQQKAR